MPKDGEFLSSSKPLTSRHARFAALDALRGLAAFSVVLMHVTDPFNLGLVGHGYLAVDFFFVLSGLVVAHAYEQRLRQGDLVGFVRARLIRLYPLIFVGVALGAAVALVGWRLKAETQLLPMSALWPAITLTLLLLPVRMLGSPAPFPLDPPLWSMAYELLANAVYGLVANRLTRRVLALVIIFCGAGLAVLTWGQHGFVQDASWTAAIFNTVRVGFGFFAGCWLARMRRLPPLNILLSGAILMAVLCAPAGAWPIDIGATLFVFPALIAVSVGAPLGPLGERVADYLGRLSYPLYVLHYPFVPIFSHFARAHGFSGAQLAGLCVVEVLCMTLASAIALHLYDEPIRRLLMRTMPGGKSPPSRPWRAPTAAGLQDSAWSATD
jgi:peptidoglycan/LPS O-acetylase OafA/YrhL